MEAGNVKAMREALEKIAEVANRNMANHRANDRDDEQAINEWNARMESEAAE